MLNFDLDDNVVPLDAILRLLNEAGLPTTDIAPGPRQRFIGLRDAGVWCGVVAIEPLGHVALLRSLAVTAVVRSRGLGRRLVADAEALARSLGAGACYLMTNSATDYFARLGYAVIDRNQVPAEVRATTQFASICPVSATVMVKALQP